mgnify:CR=1 FL=1
MDELALNVFHSMGSLLFVECVRVDRWLVRKLIVGRASTALAACTNGHSFTRHSDSAFPRQSLSSSLQLSLFHRRRHSDFRRRRGGGHFVIAVVVVVIAKSVVVVVAKSILVVVAKSILVVVAKPSPISLLSSSIPSSSLFPSSSFVAVVVVICRCRRHLSLSSSFVVVVAAVVVVVVVACRRLSSFVVVCRRCRRLSLSSSSSFVVVCCRLLSSSSSSSFCCCRHNERCDGEDACVVVAEHSSLSKPPRYCVDFELWPVASCYRTSRIERSDPNQTAVRSFETFEVPFNEMLRRRREALPCPVSCFWNTAETLSSSTSTSSSAL